MKSVAAQIWPTAREGQTVRLFKSHREGVANGGQLRDFVYVRDAARVAAWLVEHPDVSGIFNLGSGKARSFKDLAEAVFMAAGQNPSISYFDMPEGIRDRYQYFTEAPMQRLYDAGYAGVVQAPAPRPCSKMGSATMSGPISPATIPIDDGRLGAFVHQMATMSIQIVVCARAPNGLTPARCGVRCRTMALDPTESPPARPLFDD
jgi:hypothetical protein